MGIFELYLTRLFVYIWVRRLRWYEHAEIKKTVVLLRQTKVVVTKWSNAKEEVGQGQMVRVYWDRNESMCRLRNGDNMQKCAKLTLHTWDKGNVNVNYRIRIIVLINH